MSPLVSVIMPVLNSENYLAEAIQSVLSQSLEDFEYIIVSEYGNSPQSEQILASFTDPRLCIIRNTERLGFVPSLNLAIRHARGKYLARIDADDVYQPNALASLSAFLEKHQDVFLCYARQRTPFGVPSPFIGNPESIKARLLFLWHMNHPMMWRRKEFIDHGIFFNENNAMEDFALFSELIHTFTFAQINEFLYIYRITENSITNKKIDNLTLNTHEIISKNLSRIGIAIPKADMYLFQLWTKPLSHCSNHERQKAKSLLRKYLFDILDANERLGLYDTRALLKACEEKYLAVTGQIFLNFCDIINPKSSFEGIYSNKLLACCRLCLWHGKSFICRGVISILRPMYRWLKVLASEVLVQTGPSNDASETAPLRWRRLVRKLSLKIVRAFCYLRKI